MSWSETGYIDDVQTPAETSDKNLDNSDSRTQDMVHSTTDFLAKFDGEENKVVNACIKEIQADPQLQTGFEKLLQSGISEDIINKIKQELQDGVEFGLDEIILKNSVYSIIEDAINGGFRVYSMNTIAGLVNQKIGDKETAAQKGVETAKMEETAAQKGVETAKMEETAKDMVQKVKESKDICLDYRTQLLVGHDDVKEKTEKKAEIAQQHLPEETKNKLKEKGYDDKFINDYILLRVTLNEVKDDSSFDKNQVAQFEKGVNELSTLDAILKSIDNACNIPDTSLSSFSTENIAQTRTELFNEDIGNDSLRQVRESNIESHKEVYNEMFPEEVGEDDLITKYGNLLQGELKQFFENYVNNTGGLKDKIEEIKKNDNPTEEDKKLLEFYNYMIAELDKKRKETDEQTKQLMEEMCIISQIRGIYMCIGQEEGKDFTLNKAREITNKNGVLTLEGHIDGVDFSVSHDTINPNQHLKIKSKLGVDPDDKNTFEIGKENNYVNSPFILPNQEEIFRVITKVVQSNDTSKSDDLPKYLDSLQNNIIGTMDKVYKDAEFAHHYITNKVKGEKIIDGSLSLIKSIKPDIDLTKPINQTNNPKLYSFLRIINFNLENSTTEEKNKLNDIISKIGDIIRDYRNGTYDKNFKYPEIIENYLINDDWKGGDEEKKLGLISDLFSYYNNCSEKSKDTREKYENGVVSRMIINDLYRDLFNSSNEKSLVAEQWKEKYNKEHADSDLAVQLSNPKDFPPSPDAPSIA